MKLTAKSLKIILVVVLVGFGVGIYLQDLQHQKSTQHAWKANRYNLSRFDKITEYNKKMNAANWQKMRDSIQSQLDTLMILRFRREVDSINDLTSPEKDSHTAGIFSVVQ
ncbi:hypothetical protein [Maribacter cobaltidurans]|uniref:Uncharacterized protein n=1 Tax=Maribacter cobaltidurans TaxID=1178778 RepID=A0A223V288_9FLAO|nr:hypothetical protein [Maribacter cobaltidurans]ASV29505.1 hypothetical protein CJ263_04295 [Maribacter cobaltidurans]GGD68440.1 hypothetical protein GCM10011412_02560 [Maribacter cobaltidurans]